ncbi:hypothetical protein E3H11_17265 [Bradyrhizobium brasilense]|uniref:pilus assembly protein TadG-related protein n=1 Tax=Bradyrhizobium brasilense TaxID=1419277 RepID=UPI0014563A31|nr:pilus assembly protein TadG-related protein [Bradyrhizobium brasilense]NLS70641.1 hypothetical protein [Bradyrhizobium brasilense]
MTGISSPKVGRSIVQNISRLMRDRRGATAFMFLVSSVGFMGMAGFGMEVSTWYLERRHGQNAADAAAIAGVLELIQTSGTYASAQTAGSNVATANGYTSGVGNTTVTIEPGTYSGGSFAADSSGSCSSSCTAVKATIARAMPRSFTALLMGTGSTNVGEVAVAVRANTGAACSLALSGGLGFSGSAAVSATNCSLASNATGSQSISFNGAGASKTQANAILVGSGGCTQTGSGSPCTQSGNLMYQPSSLDPYLALQTDKSAIPASVNSTNCTSSTPAQISTGTYCVGKDVSINGGVTTWSSGTYFFYNSSLSITSGSFTCNGCVFVFTGNNIGTLTINGGTVTMNAAPTRSNTYNDTNYNGILFYMDYNSKITGNKAQSCGNGNVQVSISGSSTITLNGGMYFPNAAVCVSGSAFSSSESCFSLVAWSIYYNGNATQNLAGCSTTGTQTAQIRAVNLVQ